jgi:hypothetical protein
MVFPGDMSASLSAVLNSLLQLQDLLEVAISEVATLIGPIRLSTLRPRLSLEPNETGT